MSVGSYRFGWSMCQHNFVHDVNNYYNYDSFCVSRDYCTASLEKHFSDNFFQEKFGNGSCG